ncbi:GATA-type zinc finger protein 1 [Osmerus eperlanus]|uniref:GATA-type zinc finger protein 1 n=1 Tax=Osmerus eperlanus TaxID=29151 RepID=UPI002E0DA47D
MSLGAELPSIRPQAASTTEDPEPQNPNQVTQSTNQVTQSTNKVTQSTILYLLQEATMLARPAPDSCFDSKSSTRPGGEPKHNSVSHKPPLQAISFLKCNQNQRENDSPCTSTCSESSQSSARCSSPWEVMSLINLQCERLLHSSDREEDDPSLGPAFSPSYAAALGSNLGRVSTGVGLVYPFDTAREVAACIRSSDQMGDMKESGMSSRAEAEEQRRSPKNSITDQSVPSQAFVSVTCGDVGSSGFGDAWARVSLGAEKEEEEEEEEKEEDASVEKDILKEPCSGSVLALQHGSPAPDDIPVPQHQQLPCWSAEEEHLYPARPSATTMAYLASSSALTLDFDSNLCVTFDPQDGVNQPQSSSQALSLILSGETGQAEDSALSQNGRPAASEPEAEEGSKQKGPTLERSASSVTQWRTKTPRKQPCPTRSVDVRGGGVQGVTFRIHTEVDDNKEQCRLLITSKYSDELSKSVRKSRVRSRSSQSSLRTSSSDEESDPSTSLHKNKMCASCRTKKTPLWRDAEDGTPLCNACGIRYKKYRVRCTQCWHIPRKEGHSNTRCFKCGDLLRLASSHRKHPAW